jgi:hypothetical protein
MATVIRGDDNWDTALKAGSEAFAARYDGSAWLTLGTATILGFNDDSTGDSFDNGSNYSTSTYKYTAPTTGVYMFWFSVYSAQNDVLNSFGLLKNSAKLNFQFAGDRYLAIGYSSDDVMFSWSGVVPLSSGDTIAVCTVDASDVYTGHSQWGGCRLS